MGFSFFDYKIKVPKTNSVMIASKLPAEKIDTPNLPESESNLGTQRESEVRVSESEWTRGWLKGSESI